MKGAPLVLLALAAAPVWAQPLEPPPEAPANEDYVIEPADTLTGGHVELAVGASGRAGASPAHQRRVRFTGDELSGTVRQGSGDPLAGGSLDGRGRLGTFSAGRLAPRWGRGLLIGAAGDPWRAEALDRGASARFRGRAGEGVMLRRGTADGLQLLYARFARRRVVGARVRRGPVGAGALLGRGGDLQASLALARGRGETELVWDRAGRWRAEGVLARSLGWGWSAAGRVRAGAGGFSSLAEGGRTGPARAVAADMAGPLGAQRLRAGAALWRYRPGVAGMRAGLAMERRLAHHGSLALGLEEQRGPRRDRGDAAPLGPAGLRAGSLRQGWWGEWWSGVGHMALGVRHEGWGERPWARGVVRSVTTARLQTDGPAGTRLAIAHSVFRVRSGESLFLPEAESDRLVLRALSGEGSRTRLEARAPFAGGRVRAALRLSTARGRSRKADWTLEWNRRARLRDRGGAPNRRHR